MAGAPRRPARDVLGAHGPAARFLVSPRSPSSSFVHSHRVANPCSEEPYALIGRVRVCEGAGGQPPALLGKMGPGIRCLVFCLKYFCQRSSSPRRPVILLPAAPGIFLLPRRGRWGRCV